MDEIQPEPKSLKPPVGLFAAAAYGLAAAVMYTLANIALRYSVNVDPFLVSAVRAAPTVVMLAPVLVWMSMTGRAIMTSTEMVPRFIAVSLLAQFFGNASFQISLGIIGLAAAVPITLGTIIIGGAFLGWLILGEPVRIRTLVAMVMLIAAVIVLSLPSSSQSFESSTSDWPLWAGAACAAASGLAYSLFGVMVRQMLTRGMSAPATMFLSGVVGTISLWTFCFFYLGVDAIRAVPQNEWPIMVAAGIFNFTAFVALTVSLKALPVVAVNLINASQVAMAAVAGVILFAEPVTGTLLTGIGLTFAGLIVLAQRNKPA